MLMHIILVALLFFLNYNVFLHFNVLCGHKFENNLILYWIFYLIFVWPSSLEYIVGCVEHSILWFLHSRNVFCNWRRCFELILLESTDYYFHYTKSKNIHIFFIHELISNLMKYIFKNVQSASTYYAVKSTKLMR